VLASLSGSITHAIATHGVYAVFGLMVVAAVFPVASELVMLYAGALASGALTGVHAHLFGGTLASGTTAFVALAVAGLLGNSIGAVVGWGIGRVGGRGLLERYGGVLHVSHARVERIDRWFARFGSAAVPLGLAAPLVRSFVAIPAGIARMPLARFLPLAVLGCAVFAFGLAGAGWALGSSYSHAHHVLRYADYAVGAGVVLLVAYLIWRRVRVSTLKRRATDSAR
jgi:membrane protein DedA with SNARE-associated domain